MKILLQLTVAILLLNVINSGIIKDKPIIPGKHYDVLKYLDEDVDPCNNFYNFACGNFGKFHPLPENELLWDNFRIVQEDIYDVAIRILRQKEHLSSSEAVRKARNMYHGCLDQKHIDSQKLKPLSDVIDKLGGWPTISNYNKNPSKFSWDLVGEIVADYGLPLFLSWNVHPYYWDGNLYNIILGRDLLRLPATAYTDINDLPRIEPFYPDNVYAKAGSSPYEVYLHTIAKKMAEYKNIPVDEERISQRIQNVLYFMGQIKNSNQYVFDGNLADIYIDTIENLQEWSDSFSANYSTKINWESYFNKAFSKTGAKVTKDTKVDLSNTNTKNMIANILALVEVTDPNLLFDFILTRLVTHMVPDTTFEMWEIFNDMNRNLGFNVLDRENYCMTKIITYPGLSLAVASQYQKYYFNLEKKLQPEEMIDKLIEAFFELINENGWMDEPAREWVRNKARSIKRSIGFPNFTFNETSLDEYYSNLSICRYNHFENSQNIRAFNLDKNSENIDKQKDKSIWTQSPLTVNAFYNQFYNKITFPASIMNEPFFTDCSSLVDYSRIGSLIGHEITHAFDSSGRYTNENGEIAEDAWNESVVNGFNERESCFIDQYSKYYIEEIKDYVNGIATVSENIADNGGIREAYRTFKKLNYTFGTIEKNSKKYTADELFFISYATMWCKIDTVTSLTKMQSDNHAPSRFRVIGSLSNMKEFSDVFNCKAGSNMNPSDKCVLW